MLFLQDPTKEFKQGGSAVHLFLEVVHPLAVEAAEGPSTGNEEEGSRLQFYTYHRSPTLASQEVLPCGGRGGNLPETMEERWAEYDAGAIQGWHDLEWQDMERDSRIRVASGVAVIPEEAFFGSCDLRAIDLSNVTSISNGAFHNCHVLERVILSTASAVEIGRQAFHHCPKLEEIDLSNATKIGTNAFSSCKALRCVTIPSSVVELEGAVFQQCNNLTDVKLCEGMQRIGSEAFKGCKALRQINIPASVTDIRSWAFTGCISLEEVDLQEGLQRIENQAFQRCGSLASIRIPSTTTIIDHYAFANCHRLRHVQLPEGLGTIGAGAFHDCLSLDRISIPSSVTLIGRSAFGDCTSLSEVTLREGIHHICSESFTGCTSLAHINIPSVALVIDIGGSTCQRMGNTLPTDARERMVVSKWLQYRSPIQLEQAEVKVNEILSRPQSEEPRDDSPNEILFCQQQDEREKSQLIRDLFAYYDLLDVTTMLELAIWRVNMVGNEEDANVRWARRRSCGSDMNIIIPGVLEYLEGYLDDEFEMTSDNNGDEDSQWSQSFSD